MLRWSAPLMTRTVDATPTGALQCAPATRCCMTIVLALLLLFIPSSRAEDKPVEHMSYFDAETGGLPFELQGEYLGTIGTEAIVGAQVIARGDGKFEAVLLEKGLPGGGFFKTKVPLTGKLDKDTATLTGVNFTGTLQKGVLKGTGDGATFELHKIMRQSPMLGAPPPEGAIVLFDGSNTDEWVNAQLVSGGLLGVGPKGTRTKRSFGSVQLHIEFRTPFMPTAWEQGRGNSGVYLADQYECQVLDSFGLSGENNECGGFYKLLKPKVNMCLPPLTWQTYDFDFDAAIFNDKGKKTRNAIVTLRHNGVLIHNHLELVTNTAGGGLDDESKPGPLMLQDHGNPVHYRNIWLIEKK